jgi:putative endonuclease
LSGLVSYHAGLSAEDQVSREYARRGCGSVANRWQGQSGEIDLIAENGDGLIFIEVKKSRDFERAAERISRRQMQRIYTAASEFLAQMPNGQDTPVRFDVALVNGTGDIRIIENAFAG